MAGADIESYLAARRPVGTYRQDGMLKLDRDRYVEMPHATRDHLLAWALHESDDRNLEYIRRTLSKWDAHPECRTLGELEAAQ
jgi:hypothetical protein